MSVFSPFDVTGMSEQIMDCPFNKFFDGYIIFRILQLLTERDTHIHRVTCKLVPDLSHSGSCCSKR